VGGGEVGQEIKMAKRSEFLTARDPLRPPSAKGHLMTSGDKGRSFVHLD
jgi:hypothetical protein